MCGFLCLINYKYIDEQQFNKSLQTINHRGPDSTKAYTSSKVYFGFNRLSIRDLSVNGDQPMMNKTEDLVLVFNGEVYNYDKLKKILDDNRISLKSTSDTEVVLKLYSLFGIEKTLNLIEGMFGLVIYDKKTNKIFLQGTDLDRNPYSIKLVMMG